VEDLERKPICLSNEGSPTWGCSISKNANIVAVSANSFCITIWDLSTATLGNEKLVCKGHKHNIPCIDFSPCGKFLASASIDNTSRIWELSSGKCIKQLQIGNEWVWSVKWVEKRSIKTVEINEETWKSINDSLLQYFSKPNDFSLKATASLDFEQSESEDEQVNEPEDDDLIHAIPSEGSVDLLLIGTFHHLLLCNSSFEVVASLYHAIKPPNIFMPAYTRHMQRLSFMEYIPQLSLVIIGSQGCASVLLARIIFNKIVGEYQIMPEKYLPEKPEASALSGLTVVSQKRKTIFELECFRLFILYQNNKLFCYNIQGTEHLLDISMKML